jgi:hypothetical protein
MRFYVIPMVLVFWFATFAISEPEAHIDTIISDVPVDF